MVRSNYFVHNTCKCLKLPGKEDQNEKCSKFSDYVSVKDDDKKDILFENNCWMIYHSEGVSCYFYDKKEIKNSSS